MSFFKKKKEARKKKKEARKEEEEARKQDKDEWARFMEARKQVEEGPNWKHLEQAVFLAGPNRKSTGYYKSLIETMKRVEEDKKLLKARKNEEAGRTWKRKEERKLRKETMKSVEVWRRKEEEEKKRREEEKKRREEAFKKWEEEMFKEEEAFKKWEEKMFKEEGKKFNCSPAARCTALQYPPQTELN